MPKLTAEILLRAYSMGIFPMANGRDNPQINWIYPRLRGIIPLDQFHISKSLNKTLRKRNYWVSVDQNFQGVMQCCAARYETWINEEIHLLYQKLYQIGYAHSIEIYDPSGMVGGVYGVALRGAFFGESMFSTRKDMSKVALVYLVERLKAGGFSLFDTQFLTDHLASLGGVEIARDLFQKQLGQALRKSANFNALRVAQTKEEYSV